MKMCCFVIIILLLCLFFTDEISQQIDDNVVVSCNFSDCIVANYTKNGSSGYVFRNIPCSTRDVADDTEITCSLKYRNSLTFDVNNGNPLTLTQRKAAIHINLALICNTLHYRCLS